jgi:hypothetical protein
MLAFMKVRTECLSRMDFQPREHRENKKVIWIDTLHFVNEPQMKAPESRLWRHIVCSAGVRVYTCGHDADERRYCCIGMGKSFTKRSDLIEQ